jgi:SP family general alpha glucoside:H+ symporter-like MFS transporter
MLNPTAWDWRNFAGFFWAASCGLCIVYVFFRVPEPSGRTFAELDILFERGISARKFAATQVDVFGDENERRGEDIGHDGEKAKVVHEEFTAV